MILTGSALVLHGCYLFGTDDEGAEATYQLTTQISPEGSGTVDPSSGEFDEGSELSVEAQAEDGWEFSGWSGDLESQDNPLSLIIDQDVNLTANFDDFRSVYTMDLTVSDAANSLDLALGQNPQPALLDEEAPPPPPWRSFHVWFERDGERLFADYRSDIEREVVWQLMYQPGRGDEMTLSWSLEPDKMEGVLQLVADDGTVLVEGISGEDAFTFTADDYEHLEFHYELE